MQLELGIEPKLHIHIRNETVNFNNDVYKQ